MYEKWEKEWEKTFQPKPPINWAYVKYAKQGKKYKKYAIQCVSASEIEITEYRYKYRLPAKDVAGLFDLYDNKGRLVSRAADYKGGKEEV